MKYIVESPTSRRGFLGMIGAGALVLLPTRLRAAADRSRLIKVYKSPDCACCGAWTKIMERHGFEAEVVLMDDITQVKRLARVPEALESCHTAVIDGYVVEGHVPVAALEKMLAERPEIAGIAVPGMPFGSPGMPAEEPEPFDVIAFTAEGRQQLYMSFR